MARVLGFLVFGGLLVATRAALTTLSMQVDPLTESCVYEDVGTGSVVDVAALVYRGGKLDIGLRVEAPDGSSLYDALVFSNLDSEGRPLPTIVKKGHRFAAPTPGVYGFCLNNKMARWTAKLATMDIEVLTPEEARAYAASSEGGSAGVTSGASASPSEASTGAATEAGSTPRELPMPDANAAVALMRHSSQRLMTKLGMIEGASLYHKHRESRHRDTVESTNGRVLWWTVVKGIAIVLVYTALTLLARRYIPDQGSTFASFNALVGSVGGGLGKGISLGSGLGSTPSKPPASARLSEASGGSLSARSGMFGSVAAPGGAPPPFHGGFGAGSTSSALQPPMGSSAMRRPVASYGV